MHLTLPATNCDDMCKWLPTRNTYQRLRTQGFLLRDSHVGILCLKCTKTPKSQEKFRRSHIVCIHSLVTLVSFRNDQNPSEIQASTKGQPGKQGFQKIAVFCYVCSSLHRGLTQINSGRQKKPKKQPQRLSRVKTDQLSSRQQARTRNALGVGM